MYVFSEQIGNKIGMQPKRSELTLQMGTPECCPWSVPNLTNRAKLITQSHDLRKQTVRGRESPAVDTLRSHPYVSNELMVLFCLEILAISSADFL